MQSIYGKFAIINLEWRPLMPYKPIEINRQNLTVMRINFSSINSLNAVVNPSERSYLNVINIYSIQPEAANG